MFVSHQLNSTKQWTSFSSVECENFSWEIRYNRFETSGLNWLWHIAKLRVVSCSWLIALFTLHSTRLNSNKSKFKNFKLLSGDFKLHAHASSVFGRWVSIVKGIALVDWVMKKWKFSNLANDTARNKSWKIISFTFSLTTCPVAFTSGQRWRESDKKWLKEFNKYKITEWIREKIHF